MDQARIDRLRALAETSGRFTVEIHNELAKHWQYRGHFGSEAEAVAYAKQEAGRSRKFAVFTVFTGTPKNPGKAVKGHVYRGKS